MRREFGPRSERFLDKDPQQDDLFFKALDKAPLDITPEESHERASGSTKAGKPPRKTKRSFAKNLPRREVIIPADTNEGTAKFLRYEITELLNYIPPVYEIIVQKREIVVYENKETHVVELRIAANPKRLLPKARVTSSFLAAMIVGKLYDRQPLYHLEKKYVERFNFSCPRHKMARWVIDSAQALQGLVNLYQDQVLDYDIALCDPTHLQVIDEPGRAATTMSYVVSIRGGPPDKAVVLYRYNPENHSLFLTDFFEDYQGYLQVDGQNIFDHVKTNNRIQLAYCNSHARRKFEPIAKASQSKGLASDALQFYQAIYKIERAAKNAAMTAEERYRLRQEKTKPLMDEFDAWCQTMAPLTLPQSPLGKAFQYVNERQGGLRLFLNDGRLEADTNGVERCNKDFALARHNFLFSYSVEGAKALCVHASLIFTAILHGLDPYHYYVHIMERVPYCTNVEAYEALLPWNVKLAEPMKKTA